MSASLAKQTHNIENIDINDIIECVKKERQQKLKEFAEEIEDKKEEEISIQSIGSSPISPISSSIDASDSNILEWEEIRTEDEAKARKNRNRINCLTKLLQEPVVNSMEIRSKCWCGIPWNMRPSIWRILLGYIPKNISRRRSTLNRKRNEYYDLIERYYNKTNKENRSDQENKSLIQIGKDVKRMNKLFQIYKISDILSRALYIWSLKHTATGYVQGIHDLITPFIYIFLDEYLQNNFNGISLENNNDEKQLEIVMKIIRHKLTKKDLLWIEADSYWCLDSLIEGLQTLYVDKQPGITKMMLLLEDVIKKINISLYKHFKNEDIKFYQFSYRWMNCLLMRELSLTNIIRLWDTYFCEGVELSAGFTEFHVFVCAALLLSFSDILIKKNFDQIILFLQNLQSITFNERQIETILSQAFVYQQLFGKHKKSLII